MKLKTYLNKCNTHANLMIIDRNDKIIMHGTICENIILISKIINCNVDAIDGYHVYINYKSGE